MTQLQPPAYLFPICPPLSPSIARLPCKNTQSWNMEFRFQISEFRIREIPLVIYRRMVSLQKHRINEKCSPHDKYEIWPIEIPLQSKKNVTQTILIYECTLFVLLRNWIKFSFNLNFIFCLKLLHYVADNLWSFQISCNIQIIFRNKFKVSTLPGAASKFGLQ